MVLFSNGFSNRQMDVLVKEDGDPMADPKEVKILRLLLFCAAFGWGISAFAVFMPWKMAVEQLQGLGAGQIPPDPMLNYWLRMAGAVFTAIGVLMLLIAINPRKYAAVIPFAGYTMIAIGITLLTWGIILNLDPIPFWIDSAFCLLIGIGILLARKKLPK